MRENTYQSRLIRRLEKEFPGCIVVKNPSDYLQGIPDLTVYYGPYYAMLEVKVSEFAPCQPNQAYYVELFASMGYASFIFPENEERVFDELSHAFGLSR